MPSVKATCRNFTNHTMGAELGVPNVGGSYGTGNVGTSEGMNVYTAKSRKECKAGGGVFSRKGFN